MRDEELLIRLTQAQGVAGYEKEVRGLIKAEAAPYADEIIKDAIGNLIVLKKGPVVRTRKNLCLRRIWMRLVLW